MSRRTPPRPVNVEELFPELRPWRREAIRLHPRSGQPTCHDSSVGGPPLWPQEQPWPVCKGEHYDRDTGEPYEGEVYLAPIVQLHQVDVPDAPFPPGRDLLQVLWCPYDHGELLCPLPQVYWRSSPSVDQVRPTPAPMPKHQVSTSPTPVCCTPNR